MPLTLVVEDGTGLTNANSYVTRAEADDIMEANILAFDTWDALVDSAKDAVLIYATRYLDSRADWNGVKTVAASALRWPRTGVLDRDGETVDEDEVPYQLKLAVVELARFLAVNDLANFRSQDGLKQVTADVVTLIFNEKYRLPKMPSEIQYLIQGLGAVAGNRGFGKVVRT